MRKLIGGVLLLITAAILAFRMTAHLGASDSWLFYWISLVTGIGGIRLLVKKARA